MTEEIVSTDPVIVGIKETKEFVIGCVVLGKFIAEGAKNGIDWTDATSLVNKIISDEEFRNTLLESFKGIKELPKEVKDLKWEEIVELITALVAQLQK